MSAMPSAAFVVLPPMMLPEKVAVPLKMLTAPPLKSSGTEEASPQTELLPTMVLPMKHTDEEEKSLAKTAEPPLTALIAPGVAVTVLP